MKYLILVLEKGRANTDKREEKRKEEEKEEEDQRYGYMSWVVWDLSIVLYGSIVLD